MTKEEYLSLCSKRYDALQALNKLDNFYDYESEFATIMKDLGKEVLEKHLSELPADRRKNITIFDCLQSLRKKSAGLNENKQIAPTGNDVIHTRCVLKTFNDQ